MNLGHRSEEETIETSTCSNRNKVEIIENIVISIIMLPKAVDQHLMSADLNMNRPNPVHLALTVKIRLKKITVNFTILI